MAGANIDIKLEGLGAIQAALQRLQQRTTRLTPVFRDIGEYLLLAHDERFEARRSPEGAPWKPLSKKYQTRKKRNRDKILVLDDLLAGTLRYQVTAASLLFGTDRVYGATHQFGDEDRGIPARPFLGLSAADREGVLGIIEDHIQQALSG